MANKITNSTIYTKKFYRKIAFYRIGKSLSSTVVFVGVVLMVYSAIQEFIQGTSILAAWISLFTGIIILPLIGLGIPYLVNMIGYKVLKKKNGGKDYQIEIEYTATTFRVHNSFNECLSIPYDKVKNYEERKNLIIITPINTEILYLNPESFVNCSASQARQYLQARIKK